MTTAHAPRSIEQYLKALREALAGEDPALIQDALYDAEEYLRAELPANPGKSEADVLELIASTSDATRSAARFTIYHGVPKPEKEPEEPPVAGPRTPSTIYTDVLEKRLQRLLNTFRVSIGCVSNALAPQTLNAAQSPATNKPSTVGLDPRGSAGNLSHPTRPKDVLIR